MKHACMHVYLRLKWIEDGWDKNAWEGEIMRLKDWEKQSKEKEGILRDEHTARVALGSWIFILFDIIFLSL